MKNGLIWATLVLVLVVTNVLIYGKEQTLANGQSMLLQLAPRDPRSLMQGDYLRLRYGMANQARPSQLESSGHLVVSLDENNMARFVRIHTGEPLQENEHLLFFRNREGLRLGAESFFFQEGMAEQYENARYGELKVDASGNSILVGLRDAYFTKLGNGEAGRPAETPAQPITAAPTVSVE